MTNPTPATFHDSPTVDEEEDTQRLRSEADYRALLARLSEASVHKHYDAYADIAWDDPELAVDPEDPRWCIREANALGDTAWYRAQPVGTQARIGLHMATTFMKIGSQFESVLKRGLLEFAVALPNGSPEFRYAYHEVIEEAQHALMFQEFVNRSGLDVRGLSRPVLVASRQIARLGRTFPELFFFFVLGGEDPIDYQQRASVLAHPEEAHPLLRRVCQIHVTEEARHLSFARAYLRRRVPELPARALFMLRVRAPLLLGNMARFMMQPSREIVRTYCIPRSALREAYVGNPRHRERVHDALAKVRALADDLEIRTPPFDRLWHRMGIAPAA